MAQVKSLRQSAGLINSRYIPGMVIFLIMAVYFIQAHPIVPFDGDDWAFFSGKRPYPFPQWRGGNPIKVVPEVFQPLCGLFAVYVVRPFVGDYFMSLVIASGLAVSVMIAVYMYCFSNLFEKIFSLSKMQGAYLAGIFFLGSSWVMVGKKHPQPRYLC